MLDQNTDRMWFVIGAVIVGAAIIFIANGSLPTLFASVGDTMQGALSMAVINDNLLIEYRASGGWLNHDGLVSNESPSVYDSLDWTSDFIAVDEADYITFSTNGRHQTKRAMFYTVDKEPMLPRSLNSEPLDTVMVYVVPEDAEYIRVSGMDWAPGYFKVEHGKFSTGPPPESTDPNFARNLILNSAQFTKDYYVEGDGLTVSVTAEGFLKVVAEEGNDGRIYFPAFDRTTDHLLTLSDELEEYSNKLSFSILVQSPDYESQYQAKNPKFSLNNVPSYGIMGVVDSDWRTIYRMYEWDEEFEMNVSVGFNEMVGTFYFDKPKLEMGASSTPYTEAPED